MYELLKPVKKDATRAYGELEREIIFYRDKKQCAVCGTEINWNDLEIHHIEEHQSGGQTTLENGVSVHKDCHPKGKAAIEFSVKYKETIKQEARPELFSTSNNNLVGLKSQSPSALEWARKIPELKDHTNIRSWTDICTYLNLDSRGDSARRVLKRWAEANRPDWEPIPGTEAN